MTRVGHMSKILWCGDYRQTDINKKKSDMSGLSKFLEIAQLMQSHTRIEFTVDDIVRSSLVKDWIVATMKYDDMKGE
jgi:phosphate starvation-inducible PhoH-like protein